MPQRAKSMRRKYTRKPTVQKQIAKLTRAVKAEQPELKPFDGGASGNITTTGAVTNLFIPSQGTTYINREGIKCSMKSFFLNMTFVIAPAATNTHVRLVIFRGRNESGVAFTPTNILLAATPGAMLSWLERDKFTIVADRYIDLADSGDSSSVIVRRRYNVGKKLCYFTGNGTGVQDGGLYMLLIADEVTNLPSYSFQSRITFTG